MVTHDPRGAEYVDEIHHLDKGVLHGSQVPEARHA
jgi:hypothetical protein